MIDLAQLRREPEVVKAALSRRGVPVSDVEELETLDREHRRLLQDAERLRAEVKELSRQVGEARRGKDVATAEALTVISRARGRRRAPRHGGDQRRRVSSVRRAVDDAELAR